MKPLKPFEISFDGINLVEASAGTGKTYNITSLYIRALIELDVSVSDLLVVTYTEAATKELKDRLLIRIRESIKVLRDKELDDESDQFLKELLEYVAKPQSAVLKLEKAVRNFDESAIYTIHGFCYQALQEQAFESRYMYDAEMIGEDSELVQEVVDDYWRNWVAKVSGDPEKKLLLKLLLGQNYTPEKLASELGTYVSKPYLSIIPQKTESKEIEAQLSELLSIYDKLQDLWTKEMDTLFDLLDTGNLSYYTTNKLDKWFGLMENYLEAVHPNFETFTQFYRFEQHQIDDSLNKKAREGNISPPQHTFFKLTEVFSETLKEIKRYDIVFKKELLEHIKPDLRQKKEEQQVLSYDDLLLRLREALYDEKHGPNLALKIIDKHPIALVDEFQDTDPNQYDIFRKIYGSQKDDTALFMIGDPKQSIYSFRGADIFSYIEARKDAPESNKFMLKHNFRSTPKLLEGLNSVWARHNNPFLLDDISYKEIYSGRQVSAYKSLFEYGNEHPPIRFRLLDNIEKESKSDAAERTARDTASEIERLINDGKKEQVTIGDKPLKAKDIAVLVRTHKQADLMRDVLNERGIKSVQYSQQSVFKSEEARYLEIFLKAVADPGNESQIKTALSLPLTSFNANELLNIEEDEERWVKILERFLLWNRQWHEQGFAAMFRSLMQGAHISEHVIGFSTGERRLTNLQHLGELLQYESLENKDSPQGLLKWLAQKCKEESNQLDEEQLRLESDQGLVKVVTMHRSKGLEYPVVFCPFLWYGREYKDTGQPLVYHDQENRAVLDLTGKSSDDRTGNRFRAEWEDLAESMRLAYVAMTRAEYCLYLSWNYASNSEFSALGYLFQESQQVEESLRAKLGDAKYKSPDEDFIRKTIQEVCSTVSEYVCYELDFNNQPEQLSLTEPEEKTEFKARAFNRDTPITTSFAISSFSSLTSGPEENTDIPDYDQFDTASYQEAEVSGLEKSIFSFPRGPQPGTCIHNIFEEVNFQDHSGHPAKVRNQLDLYGIGTDWEPVVTKMLNDVLNKDLSAKAEGLKLSAVEPENLIPEMEFYFSSNEVKLPDLLSIIRNDSSVANATGYAASGFLKGFIDLTFQFNDKYYLLDYKTNHLGNSIGDYAQEPMKEEMHHHMYDLQYHLYTIALHRFLKDRVPDYSYKTHFGGAFYLFIRGINDQGGEGIYLDRPADRLIQKLDSYLQDGGTSG